MTKGKKEMLDVLGEWTSTLESRLYELDDEGSDNNLYHTIPVDIDTFAESSEYLGIRKWKGVDSVLSDKQREFLEKATDFENGVTDLVLWVGKGGGKNFVVSFMYCYMVYKLLCMRNPHEYFNHNPSKPMTLLNVAVNADTAKENFFNFVSTTIRGAGEKAFREHGFDPDKHMGATEIRFPKNILIKSGHSKAGGRLITSMPLAI